MSITVELLDSMLAPPVAAGPRALSVAETHYRSIPPAERVRGLIAILRRPRGAPPSDSTGANANAGRSTLAAVLLRREIGSQLISPSAVISSPGDAATALLRESAEPLVSLFLDGAIDRTVRGQVGRCVAELCSSLAAASPNDANELMKAVLNQIQSGCSAVDVTCLRLLSDLSERAPVTLWSVGTVDTFLSLFQGAVANLAQSRSTPEDIGALLAALCQVGIASEDAKRMSACGSGTSPVSRIERAVLSQLPTRDASVDPRSPASRLGGACLPSLMEALVLSAAPTPAPERWEATAECMSHLSACAARCPSLLAGSEATLISLVRACMNIARFRGHEEDEDANFLRLSALDVLAAVCNVPSIKRSFLQGKDAAGTLVEIVRVCAEVAVNGVDDDEESWSSRPASIYDGDASWEGDDAALHAESLLESFVESLGGAATLPHALPLVETLLADPRWRLQRAGLAILDCCLSSAPVMFAPHAPAAAEAAVRLCGASSVRVQLQALRLIGALCCANSVDTEEEEKGSDRSTILVRETYGGQILHCISRLVTSPCTQVSASACLAIVSYCRGGNCSENCMVSIEKSLIVPYLGDLLTALSSGPLSVDVSQPNAVAEGALAVLVRAIGAVACLAAATEIDFLPHYNVMGGLMACVRFGLEMDRATIKAIPSFRNHHEFSMLRGAAIEAASIIGQAVVGEDGENTNVFIRDASDIMEIAMAILKVEDRSSMDVISMDQLLAACARIAAVMGSRYVQFIPSVLPELLKRATEKIEVSVTDDGSEGVGFNEGDNFDGYESYSVSLPGMGKKKVTINTTQIEGIALSARAVYEHARSLGAEFGPFAEASAGAFLPLVSCEYSAEVRSCSSQALAQIFKSACKLAAGNQPMPNDAQKALPQQMLPSVTKALVKQLKNETEEDDSEIRYAIADAISEVMYDAFDRVDSNGERVAQISVLDSKEIVSDLIDLIMSCLNRRATFSAEMDNSNDKDEKARLNDRAKGESELLSHLVDSIGYQLKCLGEQFFPIFSDLIAGKLGPMLIASGTSDARARFAAICLFDDCVEHCGTQAANAYSPMLLKGAMEGLDDNINGGDIELKQASIYGIAQIARHTPESVNWPHGDQILQYMYSIAKAVESTPKDQIEDLALVENAVSCLASLAIFHGSPLSKSIPDKASLTNVFLRGLPIQEDEREAQICHDGLCDLIESGVINFKAESNNLIRIIGSTFAMVADGEEVATPHTCRRLTGIIEQIQQEVDEASTKMAFGSLTQDAQEALSKAVQEHHMTRGSPLATP